MNRLGNTKGIVLLLSFIMMAVTAVIVFVFLYLVTAQQRNMTSYTGRVKAYWLAEAGTQRAVKELRTGAAYRATPSSLHFSGQTLSGAQGVYSVDDVEFATDASGATITNKYIITSTGTVGDETRTIRSIWTLQQTSLFKWASFSGGSSGGTTIGASLSGQALTDSYDAAKGAYNALLADGSYNIGSNGDLGTNADITTSGQAHIGGDAITGPLGTYSDQTAVSGAISHTSAVTLPPVTVPSLAWLSLPAIEKNKDNVIDPGNYTAPNIDLSGQTTVTFTGRSTIYLTGSDSIKMGAQNSIIIAGTGPVIIYIDGNATIGGQGIVNNSGLPANFQIYGTSTCTSIDYNGQTAFYGAIYALQATMTMSGQSGMYGAFIADQTIIGGVGGVHYDESLLTSADIDPQITSFSAEEEDYHQL